MTKLAVVGSGPMALYALKHLEKSSKPLEITVFEAEKGAGTGMPYRAGTNADDMLCNAYSKEIPYVSRSLIEWLKDQPERELSSWELSSHDLSPRAFYPRVLIGEYLRSEFEEACKRLREAGHTVHLSTNDRVMDIMPEEQGFTVKSAKDGKDKTAYFDNLILATGHVWPESPEIAGIELVSPWPYTNITELPPSSIGVLGSSLSAIDVVVALGIEHGEFVDEEEQVRWLPRAGTDQLKISMVSLRNVMPEGDFYYPLPYEPLEHITKEAVLAEVARGSEGLLKRVFDLLVKELDHADPEYLSGMGQDARTLSGFADAYFARREKFSGLDAVKRDLSQTRKSLREKRTIPHRYALLRGHNSFDYALRHFTDEDFSAFQEHLMPVFADCYAAVPHLSLARVVALYDAGVLELHATVSDSAFRQLEDGSIEASVEAGKLLLEHLIDARGQAPYPVSELPFPSLVSKLKDAEALSEPFRLRLEGVQEGHVYCLAMPQILERYPFSQGLAGCHELAEIVVEDLLELAA